MPAVVPSVTTPEVLASWLLRSCASIKNKTKQNKTKTKNEQTNKQETIREVIFSVQYY